MARGCVGGGGGRVWACLLAQVPVVHARAFITDLDS